MNNITSLTLTALLLAASPTTLLAAQPVGDSIDVDGVMRVAARKFAAFDASQPNKTNFPTDAKGAQWRTVGAPDWASGFYPGSLWYLYEYARDQKWPDAQAWRARAETWTAGLESQQFNSSHHDTGFVMFDSYGNGYRLTGNPAYLPILNRTAQSLASRYRADTGMIRSWGKIEDTNEFTVIIDNMMNLELLVWASAHGGTTSGGTSAELRKVATSHADCALELFFRPDGGTYHVVELNPRTGKVLRKRTAQGKADESIWSRGQTWAIYGYAYMYEATGERRYLEASLKAADRYLALLPADFVPPADFDSDLKGLEFKDSSAAAIAASAFLRLHRVVDAPALKKKYLDAATATLRSLTSAPYFSKDDDKASLLVYAARNYHADPNNALTNTSLIWGDYYLLEALLQYQAITTASAMARSKAEGLDSLIAECRADQTDLNAVRDVPGSLADLKRKDELADQWLKRLDDLKYESLSPAARTDWHLLRNSLIEGHQGFELQRARLKEMEPLIGFLQPLQELLSDRSAKLNTDPEKTAGLLARASEDLKTLRKKLDPEHLSLPKPSPVLAVRTAQLLDDFAPNLDQWFQFYDGFQPEFGWWTRQPVGELKKELEATAAYFRKDLAGLKGEPGDPLIGDPVGRQALSSQLASEMIAYSADELLAIAEKEFAWCEIEMAKAATAMACKDRKEALDRIKSRHAPPGGQAAAVRIEAEKTIRFLKDKDLITIPKLAEETWGISMIGAKQQKVLPYVAYSRPEMQVAYANESMSHEDKLMSMRGNNSAFLHILTPHELIPGHHLQGFMASRYSTQRQLFSTPFFVEGWALYWEMLLWDLGYTATPEEKVGALFWRMHRCARVIVSLKFHLGEMKPEEMIAFLVDRVGHERAGATSEVRRYIGDNYGPLYQAAYMIGGLQLRALLHKVTGPGKLRLREFHDSILREGPIPIEMIRVALKGEKLPKDWKPAWKFAEG